MIMISKKNNTYNKFLIGTCVVHVNKCHIDAFDLLIKHNICLRYRFIHHDMFLYRIYDYVADQSIPDDVIYKI